MNSKYLELLQKYSTTKVQLILALSMVPLAAAGVVNYGFYVLAIISVSYVFAFIVEVSFAKFRKRKLDAGLFVTPLMFALVLPPTIPLWIVAVGVSFGTFFGKSIFGGLGKNIFHPVIVGRLFITISFPAYMATMWFDPKLDAITTATPLGVLNSGNSFNFAVTDLMIGQVPGSMGETFRLGILIIGILLILIKMIDWKIPFFYIGTVFLLTLLGGMVYPDTFEDPILSLLVGGLMFGAFFIATDPITSPFTTLGKILYGICLGILTVVIRNFAAFPEGVMFSIIIMNAVSPLLDSFVSKNQVEAIES